MAKKVSLEKTPSNDKHGLNKKIQAGVVLGVSLGVAGVTAPVAAEEVVPSTTPVTETNQPVSNANYVDENTVVIPSTPTSENTPEVTTPETSPSNSETGEFTSTTSPDVSPSSPVEVSPSSPSEGVNTSPTEPSNGVDNTSENAKKDEGNSTDNTNPSANETPNTDGDESIDTSTEPNQNPNEGTEDKGEEPTDTNKETDDVTDGEEKENPSTDLENPTDKPKDSVEPDKPSEPDKEDPTPTELKFNLGGEETVFLSGNEPLKVHINEGTTFTYNKGEDITYIQATRVGAHIDVNSNGVLPVLSQIVAIVKGEDVVVAEVTSDYEYPLNVSYNKDSSSVGYHFTGQLLEGDSLSERYFLEIDGERIGAVDFNNGVLGGEVTFDRTLEPGEHTLKIIGTSVYGVPVVGTVQVNIGEDKPVIPPKEEEKPVVPTTPEIPPVTPTNPTTKPDTEKPTTPPTGPVIGGEGNGTINRPVTPINPDVPSVVNPTTPSLPGGNVNTGGNTTITFPPINNQNNNQSSNNNQGGIRGTVTPPVVKEPPRGISDVSVGGVSIYGEEGVKGVGVVSNRGTTTFTDPSSLDLRVNLDSKIVDSSRTVLKLVGRKQGELDSNEFIEMKNGSYRLKGVAKDDFYTLTIRAYDRSGKLVTDTTETFSINRVGSRFNLTNKELVGKSVKSLSHDVQITEANIDKIDTSKTKIRVTRDGKVIEIDKDLVKTKVSGGKDTDWKYTYTINKKAFKKDGVYNIEIFSESESGVKYDSTKRTIQFIVDTKAPTVEVLGIKSKGRYKSAKREVLIQIKDISNIKSVKAFLNGKEIKLKYDKDSQTYSYVLESSGEDKNTLVIEATDEAGNVATETVSDFYLSEDLSFSLLNDNNMYYLFGGLLATGATFLGYLGFRRKKRLDEEDRLAMEQAILLSESKTSSQQINDDESESVNVEELLESKPVVDTKEVASDIGVGVIATGQAVEEATTTPLTEEAVTELLEEEVTGDVNEDEPVTDVLEEEDDSSKTEIIGEDEEDEELPTDVIDDDTTSGEYEATEVIEEEEGSYEATEVINEDDYEVTEVIDDEELATDIIDEDEEEL